MSAAAVAQNNLTTRPKAFFVFDLDETIGRFSSPFNFVWAFLFPEMERNKQTFIGDFTTALRKRYDQFVKEIGQAEASTEPLGILRPGILDIFSKIADYNDRGILGGVVIFSNNGSLQMLRFARDIIHAALGRSDIICDCIYRTDPRRQYKPFEKKFSDVQNILKTGPCHAFSVFPHQVMFFDDLDHPDMLRAIGTSNYIKIEPYEYDVSADKLLPFFLSVISSNALITNEKLAKYWISKLFKKQLPGMPIDTLKNFLLKNSAQSANAEEIPDKDEDYIQSILDQMDDFVGRLSTTTMSYKSPNHLNRTSTNENNLYRGGKTSYKALFSARKRLLTKWARKGKTRKYSRKNGRKSYN